MIERKTIMERKGAGQEVGGGERNGEEEEVLD